MPQSSQIIKNGSVKGKPKRLCKSCGYGFVAFRIKGVDVKIKPKTLLPDSIGASTRRVAALSGAFPRFGEPVGLTTGVFCGTADERQSENYHLHRNLITILVFF